MERRNNSIVLLLVVITLISFTNSSFFLTNCKAAGSDIHVYVGESIQAAINSANESDTIYVHSGTYYGNLEIDKQISLVGDGSSNTFIYGTTLLDIIDISYTNNVEISDFTITQNITKSNNGIYINNAENCVVEDCIIKKTGIGIWIRKSNSNTIEDNLIEQNEDAGVTISTSSSSNTIVDNEIKNNGKGVYISDSNCENNLVYNNDFYFNDYNAQDYGDNNDWDDGSTGNKWSDYEGYNSGDGTGTVPYSITGSAGSQDNEPTGYFLNIKPTAYIVDINPNPAEVGVTITFTGEGTDDDGIIYSYKWTINGVTYNDPEVEVSGFSAGTYNAELIVYDGEDWSKPVSESFQVTTPSTPSENQKPTASITYIDPDSVYFLETVTFLGHGTDPDPDGRIEGYEWNSSIDGFLSNKNFFTSSSLSIGEHTIYFRVKDNNNAWSNQVQGSLTVLENTSFDNLNPVADIGGPYLATVGNPLTFDGSGSYDLDGSIVSYLWDFGNGITSEGETVYYTYTQTGEFTVTLTVEDNYGFEGSNSTTATISSGSVTGQQNNNNGQNGNDSSDTTGFEIIIVLTAICLLILISKKRKI